MSTEAEVRAASTRFYEALNQLLGGDVSGMDAVWSHGATVSTMHPIGGREIGWEAVRASFAGVGQLAGGGHVRLDDQVTRVVGDLAYELGVERGQAKLAGEEVHIDGRVTNIYQREGGTWKLVHHHGDPSSSMLALLQKLRG